MENTYSNEIIKRLGISAQIDKCEIIFKVFLEESNIKIHDEMTLLKSIKIFLLREEKAVRASNKGSRIPNYDCLTLSIITCSLASRYGYEVSICRPNSLPRYFHSMILRSNGVSFKIAGKSKHNGFKKLSIKSVVRRLTLLNALITPLEKIIA